MYKYALVALLVFIAYAFSANRTEVIKVVKPDTVVRIDTSRMITYDTIKYVKTYKDTAILVKTDTIKIQSKHKAK